MAQSPRIRRAGIAALSALALTMSPLTVVSPLAGAAESAAAEQANPDATMSVVAESPNLSDVRYGGTLVSKLSDGSYFVMGTGGWGDAPYTVIGADLQPTGVSGEIDMEKDSFVIINDTLYYFRNASSWSTPPTKAGLYKRSLSKAGAGDEVLVTEFSKYNPEDDHEYLLLSSIGLSADKGTIAALVKHTTKTAVNAELFTFNAADGQQTGKTVLPDTSEVYPDATHTRGDVYSGSPFNGLRGLADGSWLFYSNANVTKDAADGSVEPIHNPPLHISPSAAKPVTLFDGASDLVSGAGINGLTVSEDGTKIALWDAGGSDYNPRTAKLFVYDIAGNTLTKKLGSVDDKFVKTQGVLLHDGGIYTYSLNGPSVNRLDDQGDTAETLSLAKRQDPDQSTHYGNNLINDGEDILAIGGTKGYPSVVKVARVSVEKQTPINEKYDFRYTFADSTGGYVKPGEKAVKKPVFEDVESFSDLPAPPEKEITGYAFKDVTRDDVSIDPKTGYVTFTPKNEDDIPEGQDQAFVLFPVTVTYTDGTTATSNARFTAERAEPKKTDAETWVIDYNNSTIKDATVGEEVSVSPKADDRTDDGWNLTEVPEGTTFAAYPAGSDKALPEGAALAEDGTITYTAPAYAAGKTIEVPLQVTFKDGSKGKTSAFFKVAEKVEPTTTAPTTTAEEPAPTTTSETTPSVEPAPTTTSSSTPVEPTTTEEPAPAPIADKYDFHYAFTSGNGGNVVPGGETDGSATKKPAFTNKDTQQEEPTPLKEAASFEFVNNDRDDVTMDDKGYVTFTPKNSDDIKEGEDSALVNFPVKVTYTDGSTATSGVTFTVFRPAGEIDKDSKPLADVWAIHYGGSLAIDATVGEKTTAKPEADDKTDQKWNPGPVPEGTTFAAYPADDADHALPEGASVAPDGTVTYTPPASAAGKTVAVPLLVTFDDGSKNDATAFFKVASVETQPTQSTEYALTYGTANGTVNDKIVLPVKVLDSALAETTAPEGAAFSLVSEDNTEGINIDPATGELTFTPAKAGTYNGIVRMSYDGGKTYTEGGYSITVKQGAAEPTTAEPTTAEPTTTDTPAPAEPTLSFDYLPTYGVGTGKVGEKITRPVSVLDFGLQPTDTPADAVFELADDQAIKGLSIDPKTGELTLVSPVAGELNGLVRMYFDNGTKYGESGFSFRVKGDSAAPTTTVKPAPTTTVKPAPSTTTKPVAAEPTAPTTTDVSTPTTNKKPAATEPVASYDFIPSYGVATGLVGEKVTRDVKVLNFGLKPTDKPADAVFKLSDDTSVKGLSIDPTTGELTLVSPVSGEINGYVRMYFDNGTKYSESGFSFLIKDASIAPTTTTTEAEPAPTTTEPSTEPTVESTTEQPVIAPTPVNTEDTDEPNTGVGVDVIIATIATLLITVLGLLVSQNLLNLLPGIAPR